MADELTEAQIEERVAALAQVPLLSELREADLRYLARNAVERTYLPDQELYHQSDVDGKMFVIRSGQIALYYVDPLGEESLVGNRTAYAPEAAEPSPGWLGEASVLLNDPHDVTAIAVTAVRVLEISHSVLMNPEIALRDRLKPAKPEHAERVELIYRNFKWREKDEVIMKYVQQHSWALYQRMIIPLGVIVVLFILTALASQTINALSVVLIGLLMMIPIVIGVIIFIDWRDDFYVVTNKRVMHLDQVPWSRQKIEEAPLGTIIEVQVSRLSPPAQILDFGDLRVETFGGSVSMQYVPEPDEVRRLIFREKERVQARGRAAARKAIYNELTGRVGQADKSLALTEKRPAEPPPLPPSKPFIHNLFRYFFPAAREVEGDRITYRKHWVALIRQSLIPFLGMFVAVFAFFNWYARAIPFGFIPDGMWFIWPLAILFFGGWSWWVFDDWRNDLYIVTDNRIIDIQRTPLLFRETRKEATLDKIQTLKADIPSALARFLRFGTVTIGVPGASFEFKMVRDPSKVQAEISRRVEKFKRDQAAAAERGRRAELSDWFAVYDQVREGHRPPGTLPRISEKKRDGSS